MLHKTAARLLQNHFLFPQFYLPDIYLPMCTTVALYLLVFAHLYIFNYSCHFILSIYLITCICPDFVSPANLRKIWSGFSELHAAKVGYYAHISEEPGLDQSSSPSSVVLSLPMGATSLNAWVRTGMKVWEFMERPRGNSQMSKR